MSHYLDGFQVSDLHDRAARVLGWSPADVRSLSMQSLRDLVRPVDPDLAREMDYVIQSGAYVREDEVDEWLEIYRRDHPGVAFIAASTRPRGKKGPKIIKGPGSEY